MNITISPAEYASLWNKMPTLDYTAELTVDDEAGNTKQVSVELRHPVLGTMLCWPANANISGGSPDDPDGCEVGWRSYCDREGIEPGEQDKYGDFDITPELEPHWDAYWNEMYVSAADMLSDYMTERAAEEGLTYDELNERPLFVVPRSWEV